jgi:CBS domain-containing protein
MEATLADVLKAKSRSPFWIPSNRTVLAAVALMNVRRIGSVLVVDDGELVGIFTERDAMQRVLGEQRDPAHVRVGEVMTRNLITGSPNNTISEALTVMSESRHRHLPVISDGKLVGLVSTGDLVWWLTRELESEVGELCAYVNGPAARTGRRSSIPPPAFEMPELRAVRPARK